MKLQRVRWKHPHRRFRAGKPSNADPKRDRSAGQEYMSTPYPLLLARFFRNGKKLSASMKCQSTKKGTFHTKTQCCHFRGIWSFPQAFWIGI